MGKLILMRHGESEWNLRNQFTGWVDVPLSEKGIEEAIEGGRKIADIPIDLIFTSTLIRAQMTAMLAMLHHHSGKVPCIIHRTESQELHGRIYSEEAKAACIPVYEYWELNERIYGALQGFNKDVMRKKYGAEQVQVWRRSYGTAPPEGESLKMTAERTIPCFEKEILPHVLAGKNVFVSAHGNSLRAIVRVLDGLSEEEVVALEIPTGEPLLYVEKEGRLVRESI